MNRFSMSVALQIENVSKMYRLGVVGTGTISHDLNRWWARLRGRDDPYAKIAQTNDRTVNAIQRNSNAKGAGAARDESTDYVWALRDIDLEVNQGEILGIIGANGAGKSTLLKLLSRVTAPTSGAIRTRGRIASLLEVGTGFHPELTGRENIYLNGAILGMKRREIAVRLEEIVEFSGCARYIDTPVKRYSSGMKVRLGFAVAAHLECETLIVDEVLAVGDAEFQKKCIGKLGQVSETGRTVLIVSHNMHVIRNLCSRGVLLGEGQVVKVGSAHEIVDHYLQMADVQTSQKSWSVADAPTSERMRLLSVKVVDESGKPASTVRIDRRCAIEMVYDVLHDLDSGYAGLWLKDGAGVEVLSSGNKPNISSVVDRFGSRPMSRGRYCSVCWLPPDFLNAIHYLVTPWLGVGISDCQVLVEDAITFEVADTSDMRGEYQGHWLGVIRPKLEWSTSEIATITPSTMNDAFRSGAVDG